MLDNLSQPVAFATAPLGQGETPYSRDLHRDGSLSSDTDFDEPISRFTRKLGMGKGSAKKKDHLAGTSAETARMEMPDEDFDEDFFDQGKLSLFT